MKRRAWHAICAAVALASSAAMVRADGLGPDALADEAQLTARPAAEVREAAFEFLAGRGVDEAARAEAELVWPNDALFGSGGEMLDRLLTLLALGDDDIGALVERCRAPTAGPVLLLPIDWVDDPSLPPLVRNNVRLFYGRWLAQELLYDEALAQLNDLQPEDVVDPASLLFYQAVVHHRLLNKDEGLAAIERLLNEVADSPARYAAVAGLMQEDMRMLEDESLDHISRRMEDIRRRLALGRAGQKVIDVEQGVIDSLDKLIEELEEQQQNQNGGGSAGGQQPTSPMGDSQLAPASGAGQTDRRNVGAKTGWGDLPEKQREEALQQIGQEFPSHYREAIEQYFRRLATEGESNDAGGR